MNETVFFTAFDSNFKETGEGMVRSVKRIYPEIPFKVFDLPKNDKFDLRSYCSFYLESGKSLFDEYKRIIFIDPDSIMCNQCPDLFDDYELGVVLNNTGYNSPVLKDGVYVNAGLSVCTSKEVWQERIDKFNELSNQRWESLNEQNALNYIYHTTTHKTKLLEFDDRTYGISSLAHYQDMFIKDNELWLPNNKKLCIFHAAGTHWKTGVKINFDFITKEDARELLRSYTK